MAPHGSRWKEAVHGFKAFIVVSESGCVKPYPTSQGGPEIKRLLQGGTLGREACWLRLPGLYLEVEHGELCF